MLNEIGDIIIGKINTLPFLDQYAGVVKPIKYKSAATNNVEKTFPASCKSTLEECESGKYYELVPDSKKKSVLYLEDKGARFIKKDGPFVSWQASYDLVCWLNKDLLGFTGCSYSAIAIMGIIDKLPDIPFNVPNKYQQVKISVIGQAPKSQDPFAKYKYDETITQYLLHPFDYFVLQMVVDFNIDKRCVNTAAIQTPVQCS